MYIIGAGGHGKVVAELAMLNGINVLAFIDENKSVIDTENTPVLHDFPMGFVSSVIAIGDNLARKRIALSYPYHYSTLIHARANVSSRTSIGEGTVIIAGATINIDAKIGAHVIINTNASVGHDCIVNDYVHVAPNVALAGNVTIGEGTHIGIAATVIQGVKIGNWCVVGAGTVVLNDVPDGAMVVGNPARIIKQLTLKSDLT